MNKAASKSELICNGAFSVLLAEGLPHLSYDKVAEAAGVTRQLVRYYYPKPEDLMLSLCDQLASTYREVLITGVATRSDKDRLAVFFDFYFDLLDGTAKPRDDQVYDALFSLAAGSPPIQNSLRAQYQLLGQVLTHELRQAHPAIPLVSCEEISFLFVTLMYGHWKMVATLGLSEDHRHISRRAIDRIVDSYLQDASVASDAPIWKAEVTA